MPSRRLVIALGLLTLGACKKDPPAEPELSPEQKRKQDCEHFANEMAQTALLAGQMLVTALDEEPMGASAQAGRDEMKGEARKVRKDLFDKCMKWPDDVMQCLPPLGILKDGCEEKLLAAMDGAVAMPKEIAPGPAPAWTFSFDSEPQALALAADGTVVAVSGVESDELVGVRDGKVAWRKPGDHTRWLVPLPGTPATWATAEENRLVAFDPSTGTDRWVATLPGQQEGDWPVAVRTAAVTGDSVLVADAEGRFFEVSPAKCAAPGQSECVVPKGRLHDQQIDRDARLMVDGEGRRYLWEDDVVRAFSADVQRQWTVGAHDQIDHVMMAGSRMVMIIDDDVVALDPKECGSGATVAPSGWPQPGALVIGSECEGCVEAPAGCRRWRAYVPSANEAAPARLGDGMMVVGGDEYTYGVHEGTQRWKLALSLEALASDGTQVFGLGFGAEETPTPALLQLDPSTGMPKWRSVLTETGSEATHGDSLRLALQGSWLAASAGQRLVVLKLASG